MSSSSTLSNVAESEPPGRTIGRTFCRSIPHSPDASCDSRARRADQVGLAREGVLVVLDARPRLDEQLADVRARGIGGVADVRVVDRHVAPAEHALALDADVDLQQLLDLAPVERIGRQEAD